MQKVFLQEKKSRYLPIGLESKKKMKIALTERQSNRHEKQDGTGEPRVARTFLDAHNATSFTPVFEYPYRVARPLAWLWVCFSLDLEFRNALPLSLPIRLLSLSLAPIWSRASRDSRAAPGCCERSSEAPVRWQPFLRPRVPSAVGATRLGSEKIAEDREWLLPAFGNTVLQISSLRMLHKRNGRSRPFKLFEEIEITNLISFKSQMIGRLLRRAREKSQARQ